LEPDFYGIDVKKCNPLTNLPGLGKAGFFFGPAPQRGLSYAKILGCGLGTFISGLGLGFHKISIPLVVEVGIDITTIFYQQHKILDTNTVINFIKINIVFT